MDWSSLKPTKRDGIVATVAITVYEVGIRPLVKRGAGYIRNFAEQLGRSSVDYAVKVFEEKQADHEKRIYQNLREMLREELGKNKK